ncbi:MAG TPA: hypothetical protein VK543_09175 [Puia sp.]|nr:hypothetical protein [Puia sp.]
MPFFDFHLHPTLKGMFSLDTSKTDPWVKIDVHAINWKLRWCSDFQNILCSQSNLSQLIGNNCNLVCVALYSPEHAISSDQFLNKQAQGTLSKYLDPRQLDLINAPGANPYELMKTDLTEVLLKPERFNVRDKKIVPLRKGIEYDPHDDTSLYVAFTIEGCHSLASTYDKNNIQANDIIRNLRDLTESQNIPIISVNLTHIEQYKFCNHAYGILFVTSEEFKPRQKEISEDGITILKECYSRKIMIDLKHMSLGARRFLVEQLRPKPEFAAINQPLICTHSGFTGLSFSDVPDYMDYHDEKNKDYGYVLWNKPKLYGQNAITAFNPSSINLYNEEILAILVSGGMIGLSLDKRILGYSDPGNRPDALNDLAFEEEYISLLEKDYFLTKPILGAKMNDAFCITAQEVLEGGEVNPDAAFYHLCHFMSHILHVVRVAGDNGYDVTRALTQVCIGSDFDGLINPIWCCPTMESISHFKTEFVSHFNDYADANADKVRLPAGFDIHAFADRLFFENGKEFLMDRLSKI